MTNEQLDELERLAAQATPGPWMANNWGRVWHTPSPDSKRLVCDTMRNTVRNPKKWRANAKLIAAMRETVPELIAMARDLERQRNWMADALQTICAWHKDYGSCPVDHVCPGAAHCLYGGLVTSGDWIEKAEQAAKETGE